MRLIRALALLPPAAALAACACDNWEVDWNEAGVTGKIDGETYFTRAIDPATMEEFLKEFFLILNVAMGGTLGSGEQPPDPARTYNQTMLVDYVRVFQSSGPQARLST